MITLSHVTEDESLSTTSSATVRIFHYAIIMTEHDVVTRTMYNEISLKNKYEANE